MPHLKTGAELGTFENRACHALKRVTGRKSGQGSKVARE